MIPDCAEVALSYCAIMDRPVSVTVLNNSVEYGALVPGTTDSNQGY